MTGATSSNGETNPYQPPEANVDAQANASLVGNVVVLAAALWTAMGKILVVLGG